MAKDNKTCSRLPVILVIIAPLILLGPIYLRGQAIFWGTPLLQFAPWWSFAWKTLSAGHLPLWNPLVGMGAPLLANYQSGLLYPPNWIHFILWSLGGIRLMAWGMVLVAGLHLIWAGLGMLFLTRKIKLGVCSQIISSLAFGLSGYLVARLGFLSINAAVAWFPWVLLFITPEGDLRLSYKRKQFVGLTASLALMLLAGHAQTAWYIVVLSVVWFSFWHIQQGEHTPNTGFLYQINNFISSWKWFGLALILAGGICAAQLLPTAEYLAQSQRADAVDYDFAMNYSYWPWHLMNFLAPDIFGSPANGDFWGFGNYWEDAVYIGLLPLLLACRAILKSFSKAEFSVTDRKMIGFLAAIFLTSLILSLGANTPIYPWLYYHIPTFNMFQAPTRWMIWGVFSLSLLAGLGAQNWRRPEGWGLYWTRLATMGAFATTATGLISIAFTEIPPTFIRSSTTLGLLGIGAGLLALNAPPKDDGGSLAKESGKVINEPVSSRRNFLLRLAPSPPKRLRRPVSEFYWVLAVGIFISADMLFAGWGLNPGETLDLYDVSPTASDLEILADGRRLFMSPEDEDFLKYDRFLQFDTFHPGENWLDIRAVMLPNTNMLDGIPIVNNFDPFVPNRSRLWSDHVSKVSEEKQAELLKLMGVGVIISNQPYSPHGVSFTEVVGERLRFVACAREVQNEEQALEAIISPEVNFDRVVVLENAAPGNQDNCLANSANENRVITADIEDHSDPNNPNRNVFFVKTAQPGWLVISDVWFPGWRAKVDGKSAPILKANFLFRGIYLTKGLHRVELNYQPVSFYIGLGISLLSLILFVLISSRIRE